MKRRLMSIILVTVIFMNVFLRNMTIVAEAFKSLTESNITELNTSSKQNEVESTETKMNYKSIVPKSDTMQQIQSDNYKNYEFTLKVGKNYEIKNSSYEDLIILNNSGDKLKFDIVQYYEDGSIGNIYNSVDGTMWLASQMTLRITVVGSQDATCYIDNSQVESTIIEEVEKPALYKYELNSHKIYTLKNIGDITLNMNMKTDTKFDVVRYNENGDIESFSKDTSGNFHIGKGKSEKVKMIESGNHTIWMPYDNKDLLEIKEEEGSEIFYTYELSSDKIYTLKNIGETTLNIHTKNNTKFDVVRYNENGDIESFSSDTSGNFHIGKGKSEKVKMIESGNHTIWMPYDNKDLLEIKEEEGLEVLYKYEFELRKVYELKNVGNSNLNFSKVYATEFDFIRYNKNGNINDFGKNAYGDINIKSGEALRVVFGNGYTASTRVCIPYEYKDSISITELDNQLFYKFIIEKDKSYEIINKSNEKVKIKNSSYWGSTYDYVKYKVDNSFTYLVNVEGDIILDSNERILISPRETIECYIPYEHYTPEFKFKELDYEITDIFDIVPKVQVDINKTISTERENTESYQIKDNLSNYNLNVYNETKKQHINDISVRGNYIIFPEKSVNANDEITIKLTSKNKDCKDINIMVKLDNNNNAKTSVDITQRGYITVNYKEDNTKSLTNRVLIYDKNGKNIQIISKEVNKSIKSDYLEDGKYTVVILKSSGELWKLDNLNEFDERGFIKDEDYIRYDLDIKEGEINAINPKSIPIVDEDRLSYFDKSGTMFTIKTESVAQNSLIEVRLEYKYKSIYSYSNIKDKKIRMELPEEVSLVDNSIIVDNKKSSYDYFDKQLDIPIENMKGVIKFNLRPMKSGNVSIKAESIFKFNNKDIKEVLGVVTAEINYLTISGPKETNSKSIKVYGIAPPKSKVSIYDGENLLAVVNSLSSGNWNANVELKKTYNGSNHSIVAKINEGTEEEKVSNELNVKYNTASPSIKKVVMFYDDHGNKKIDLTKAILEGEKPIIIFNPQKPLTFEIQIENQDLIDEVSVLSKRNNEEKKLNAVYDKDKSLWIASGYFDPDDKNYVPGTLSITYQGKGLIYNSVDIDFESEEFKESLPENWQNTTVDVIEDNENSTKLEINLNNKDKVELNTTNGNIPSNINQSNVTSLGYINIDDGRYIKIEEVGNQIKANIIDFGTNKSIEFILKMYDLVNGTSYLTGLEMLGEVGDFGNELIKYHMLGLEYPEHKETLDALTFMKYLHMIIGISTTIAPAIGGISLAASVASWSVVAISSLLADLIEDFITGGNSLDILAKWLIDPSGYVYEAVDNDRISGVTTTVYYKDQETGEAIKWNAEDYDQMNPLITDEQGKYAWDVPEGLWQVKYEKQGYETTYSEWLPVPPPQTEVNIGMVSLEKPKVELFNMYSDRAEVTFNKYIDTSTISIDSVKLSDYQGNNIPITIESVNEEKAEDGKILAKKFVLKTNAKNTLSLDNEYSLTIKNTVKTYAGVSPDSDIVEKTIYKQLPTEIKVGDSYEVKYNKEISIPVSIDNISNADEFEVMATSSMSDIAKVVTETVSFDKDGKAVIKVLGQLPGEANLTFKIEGTDLQSQTKVNVTLPNEDNTQNTPPTIEAKDIEIKVGDEFKELEGVKAYDEEDGDITSSIVVIENTVNTSTAGIYKVVYEVRDDNGSVVTKEIKVTVNPKFTLINIAPKIEVEDTNIKLGSVFNPLSIAKATDYEDGDITSKLEVIENNININKAGEYNVTYKVSDSKGATKTKTIKVTVINQGWVKKNDKWYYYKENGSIHKGWLNENGTWYYLDSSGVMKTGWLNLKGTWYYLDGSGAMKTGWLNLKGTWYYLDGSGAMKTGWLNLKGTWYYLDGSGAMKTGWLNLKGTWYYLDGSGAMKTGWLNLKGTWYYLDGSGAMKTGWLNLKGTWYYLDGSGAMKTGWLNLKGTWYYLDGSGAMKTGWLNLKGTWYYMYGSGKMATNTIIDGWKIGSNGVASQIK